MSDKLFTNLNLSEDYIVHVLGFEKTTLNEGKHNLALHYDIIEAHMLAEGWFEQGIKYLKDKSVKGYEKIKDKAFEVPNAIKQYGEDVTGIIAAITAMVNDPNEAQAYAAGIIGKVRQWPTKVLKRIKRMYNWFRDKGLKPVTDALEKIYKVVDNIWKKVQSITGVARSISMITFGLIVVYLEEQFKIFEKLEKANNYLNNPEKILKDIAKSIIQDQVSDKIDDEKETIKNILDGEKVEENEKNEVYKAIISFFKEKLSFIKEVKEKFIDFGKDLAGKALAQFAGPVAWIKSVIDFFGKSSWVISNVAEMLSQPFYDEPNPIKN